MSEAFIKDIEKQIAQARKRLEEAKELMNRLQIAGEDTADLQRQVTELEYRIQRYEQAFST